MKETSVVGLGASGFAAARLALAKGERVYVSDTRSDAQTGARGEELRALGADVELGKHDLSRIAASALVVVSPGIPPDAPVLRNLQGRGVAWISEPELAFRFFQGPLIAVTGTNGKTTTTLLLGHLLETAGVRVAAGGNVGGGLAPAASEMALLDPAPEWYVLEMSSFQLARIEGFRPDVGVFTNLAPDHLDRYASVEDYYADKARFFDNATNSSRWVLNADDPAVLELAGDTPGERYAFSLWKPVDGAFLADDVLTLRLAGKEVRLLHKSELPLLGLHNVANALAAALAARLAGVPAEALEAGLRTARPLPHRLEPVVDSGGVLWVNDSKATNVAACASALTSLTRTLVLLLGGKDKGEDFRRLGPLLGEKVRHVIAYGAAGSRIAQELEGTVPLSLVGDDFPEVLRVARSRARPGDVVLLSPACSSFDMFESYEQRGEQFRSLAREMA